MSQLYNICREMVLSHPDIEERYDFTHQELITYCEKYYTLQFLQIYIDPVRSLLAMEIFDSDGDRGWLKYGYGLGEDDLEIFDWCE